MNARQLCVVSIATAAALAAFAPVVHAAGTDMRAAVVEARARGELRPAGEAVEPYAAAERAIGRSRADVRAEVLAARAQGELMAAGEAPSPFTTFSEPSTLARATVKQEVLIARAQHALIPSGEGFGPTDPVRARVREPALAASFWKRWY